ncbi:MAG TPA: hypothetical protein VN912_04870 [Candidatus Angelobacter sp.]|nr:hypothetical protein [Candidatus Angelobacter sp.]
MDLVVGLDSSTTATKAVAWTHPQDAGHHPALYYLAWLRRQDDPGRRRSPRERRPDKTSSTGGSIHG